MPGIRFPALVDSFVDALERGSATVIRDRVGDRDRPARMQVISTQATNCIVFLWTITPGGGGPGVRPPSERRIQLTKVSGIPLEPGCRTLLGGWSEEFGVYAFWDPRRHIRFSTRSPSLQVSADVLEEAGHVGIAASARPAAMGTEVVVATNAASLVWYVENGLRLHNAEDDAADVVELARATPDDERIFLDDSRSEIQAARRYDLVETMRAYRDAQFRPAVLRAYAYRCAVCGCALKLVDAAHIVPVTYPDSSDDITNGMALCRLHHGAYDNGLLGVQSTGRIVVNPQAERRLTDLQLALGLEEFKARLPECIQQPTVIETRPAPGRLITGLRVRRWPSSLVA